MTFDTLSHHLPKVAFAASLAAALAGCGGGDGPRSAIATTDADQQCPGTPAVNAAQGYPLYKIASGTGDRCTVLAHYNAGYAIVASGDVGLWDAADAMPTATFDSPVEATDPPASGLIISTVPASSTAPASTKSEVTGTYVLAKSADGDTPIECQWLDSDQSQLDARIDSCLAPLRQAQASQSKTQDRTASRIVQAAADPNPIADANPDARAWTLLGTNAQTVSVDSYSDNWWQSNQKTGSAELTFNVYRLNSTTQNDYYLVKAIWETAPIPRINAYHPNACVKGAYCGYYNNNHDIAFSLQVDRGGATLRGKVEDYMPRTLERNKTVSQKLGGELAFGEKGPSGKISSEIAVSYSYSAMNIISSSASGTVSFSTSHATSKSDIWHVDPTTVGGVRTVAWGLFSVPQGAAGVVDNVKVLVSKFSGNFGLTGDNDWFVSPQWLYGYGVNQPYTVTFSPPAFDIKLLDEDGALRSVPTSATAPLKLRAGQTAQLAVSASGDQNTPVRLSWQVTSAPDWLAMSAAKGEVNSGDGHIQLTVRQGATPGTLDYVKINTSPRAAAASVRNGDVSIPVLVVQ